MKKIYKINKNFIDLFYVRIIIFFFEKNVISLVNYFLNNKFLMELNESNELNKFKT